MHQYPANHFGQHSPAFGDCATAEQLIGKYSSLVRRIAWQVHSRMGCAEDLEDLIQTGLIALLDAAKNYEDRGHAFSTYASMRVRGAMIDQLRRNAKVSRQSMLTRRRIELARARAAQQNMRQPNAVDIASLLGVSIEDYYELEREGMPVEESSIDQVYLDHDPAFADNLVLADAAIDRRQTSALLALAIERLPEREAMILNLYFVEELNLHEIGEVLGIGAARICQIKKVALAKLRTALEEVI
jgi:RNA polymerase sigma factor for flagellar operon FliA